MYKRTFSRYSLSYLIKKVSLEIRMLLHEINIQQSGYQCKSTWAGQTSKSKTLFSEALQGGLKTQNINPIFTSCDLQKPLFEHLAKG